MPSQIATEIVQFLSEDFVMGLKSLQDRPDEFERGRLQHGFRVIVWVDKD